MSSERAVFYVNSNSRRGQEGFARAQSLLAEQGVGLEECRSFDKPEPFETAIRQAREQSVGRILVGGGDGSLNLAAGLLAGSDSALGVVPLGTGNSFARDLELDGLEAAVEAIAADRRRIVDLGYAGDRCFLNVATLGLSTLIARSLDKESKRRFGRLVYAVAIARALARVKPFEATLETEQGRETFRTLQIVAGNGRYHAGPFPLEPDASITEGKLSIYALRSTRRSAVLRLAMHLRGGHHVELDEVLSWSTPEARVETRPSRTLTLDGEPCGSTPVVLKVRPKALHVFVGPDFESI